MRASISKALGWSRYRVSSARNFARIATGRQYSIAIAAAHPASAKLLLLEGFSRGLLLSGGIMAWKAAGLPTEQPDHGKAPSDRGPETLRWLF